MGPGTFFGESYITKKVSHQTLGDVRAGLRNLNLLKFHYSDLDRILSYPEIASIREEKVPMNV